MKGLFKRLFVQYPTGWLAASIITLLLAIPLPVQARPGEPPSSLVSNGVAETDPLLQFAMQGHIVGFRSREFYMTNAGYALRVEFVGAAPVAPQSRAAPVLAEHGAPPFRHITYANLWDGITLDYDVIQNGLMRSTYRLEPYAEPGLIRLRYNAPLTLNDDGTLTVAYTHGALTESAPLAWQERSGQRIPVPVTFELHSQRDVGFVVGNYEPSRPLFIDPTLTWNTFLGSSAEDYGTAIAVDGGSNVYVAGWSRGTWGAPVRAYGGGVTDAFVAKLDPTGDLLWNTFLGGIEGDAGNGIAVDASGNVYVSGTSSSTWGTPVRAMSNLGDGFAAKLNQSGVLEWNTFLGGSSIDQANAIAVIASGNVYVAGTSLATWGTPIQAFGGVYDGYAAQLDANGILQWNTFLGGGGQDYGYAITVDASGNVYAAGESSTTWGTPVQPFGGVYDGYAAKLDASGTRLWHTFLGGSGSDNGYAIALDGSGNVYVGGTSTATWGTPVRAYTSNNDPFAAKLDSSGTLQWNTFLGGSGYEFGHALALDGAGNLYLGGRSDGSWGTPDHAYTAGDDAFVATLDNSGVLQWNTFLGGNGYDQGFGIAVDASASVYVGGYTGATWGGPACPYSNNGDAFAAKVSNLPADPEISVQSDCTAIVSGDSTPNPDVQTDFGTVDLGGGAILHSFTIRNTGNAMLTLGANAVTLSGVGSSAFSVSSQPATSLAAGANTTFEISFDPSTTGTFSATVTVANDDSDENPYIFVIQGVGTGQNYSLITATAGAGNGTVSLDPPGGVYAPGTTVTATATANIGSTFVGWSGDCTGAAACVLTVDEDKSITATFSLDLYSVAVSASPAAGGSVSGGGAYSHGVSVTVSATANAGYTFVNWTEGSSEVSTSAAYTFSATGNRTLVAIFNLQSYSVITRTAGAGSGSISLNPPSGTYAYDTVVTATATADVGSTFAGWDGNCTGVGACVLTLDSDKHITATFGLNLYTVGVSASPAAGGSVTGGGPVRHGAAVTIMAAANPGYTFFHWTEGGNEVSTSAEYTFVATHHRTLVAVFSPQSYSVNTATAGAGSGSVTLNPPGGAYPYSTVVTVTATADPGSAFTGWSGDCTGTGSCVMTIDGNKSVTAGFNRHQYTVAVNASPAAGGSVSGGGVYNHGASVTVKATANAGYSFVHWAEGDNELSTSAQYPFTATGNRTLVAVFRLSKYTVTTATAGHGIGSVTLDPPGGVYDYGASITAIATAEPGSIFVGWSGDCTGAGNCTLSIDSNKSVTATFIGSTDLLPGKAVSKSASVSRAIVGETTIIYSYRVTNTGEVALTIRGVDDQLGTITWATQSGGLALSTIILAPNQSAVGTHVYVPQLSDLPGPLLNKVAVSGTVTAGSVLVTDLDSASVDLLVRGQAQTMCYGDKIEASVEAQPAGVTLEPVDLLVISNPAPQGLFLRGVEACVPYTGLKSMIELTNDLVSEACANQTACNPVRRLFFEPNGAYTLETIQEVQKVSELLLPVVQQACSGEICQ